MFLLKKKMIWKILENTALIIVIIFAIFGTGVLAVIVHEYSHYNDFKKFNLVNEKLCGLVLPTNDSINFSWDGIKHYFKTSAGFLTYEIDLENMTSTQIAEYDTSKKNTELKAYIVGFLIFAVYFVCYFLITYFRKEDKTKIFKYQSELEKDKIKMFKYQSELEERDAYINKLEKCIKNYENDQ